MTTVVRQGHCDDGARASPKNKKNRRKKKRKEEKDDKM